MRVNVYNEDVPGRVERTEKVANTVAFTGIRFFVSPPFEHTPGDDDTPAVTFWFSDEYRRGLLRTAFKKALELLDDPVCQK